MQDLNSIYNIIRLLFYAGKMSLSRVKKSDGNGFDYYLVDADGTLYTLTMAEYIFLYKGYYGKQTA